MPQYQYRPNPATGQLGVYDPATGQFVLQGGASNTPPAAGNTPTPSVNYPQPTGSTPATPTPATGVTPAPTTPTTPTTPAVPNGFTGQYSTDPTAQQYYNTIINTGGSGWNSQKASDYINNTINQFAGQFQIETGQLPTQDQINQYMTNIFGSQIASPQGLSGTNYSDWQNLNNAYIQNTYNPEIQQYQQGQQTSSFNNLSNLLTSFVNDQSNAQLAYWTNPSTVSSLQNAFNQNGMLNSGVFNQTLGQDIATGATQNIANLAESVGAPVAEGMYNTANAPYTGALQNLYPGLAQYNQGATTASNTALQALLLGGMNNSPSLLSQLAPILQGLMQGTGNFLGNAWGDFGSAATAAGSAAASSGAADASAGFLV